MNENKDNRTFLILKRLGTTSFDQPLCHKGECRLCDVKGPLLCGRKSAENPGLLALCQQSFYNAIAALPSWKAQITFLKGLDKGKEQEIAAGREIFVL